MPLAINVFGTSAGWRWRSASTARRHRRTIGELLKPEVPVGLRRHPGGARQAVQLSTVPPKKVRHAPCQDVVYKGPDVDLDQLPGLQAWPNDGGIFHNLGLTHTKHPETGKRNLGLYRLQQHRRRTLGLHWQIHKDSNAHHAVAERLGERLPVAIAFGCDPAVTYGASAPLPGEIDEYLFAGFLRGQRVDLVDCLTVPLQVPAHAQIVLEGYVEPGERAPEGPFGDHTGFYTPVEPFPVLHVECMTMQRDPVFQTIVTSAAAGGRADRQGDRAHLPAAHPDDRARDRRLRPARPGVFHNCVIVTIEKRYPKHAQKVMNAIWGADLLSLTKLIVVVDADCDVHDYSEVAWRAFGNVDYAHDLSDPGPGGPPRPRVVPAVLGRQGRGRRHPQAAHRGLPPRLAGAGGHVRRGGRPGGPALEGVRPVTIARRRRSRPG